MTLVALCGLKGSGKDSVASFLVDRYGFRKLSFGSGLKDVVAAMFQWDRAMLEGDTPASREWREAPDPWWSSRLGTSVTPRSMLQVIGTDVIRQFHADVWVACLERQLSPNARVVITDCRFPNEIDMVRRHGGKVVHVARGDLPSWFEPYRAGALALPPPEVHVSEYAWARHLPDHTILNNGTMADLGHKCDAMCEALGIP